MIYIAEAEIYVWPYMESSFTEKKKHTVEAESKEEAEVKIRAHYESKSESHGGINYSVNYVDFFEHIK
jgi:hypothetical protein